MLKTHSDKRAVTQRISSASFLPHPSWCQRTIQNYMYFVPSAVSTVFRAHSTILNFSAPGRSLLSSSAGLGNERRIQSDGDWPTPHVQPLHSQSGRGHFSMENVHTGGPLVCQEYGDETAEPVSLSQYSFPPLFIGNTGV